jgi:hypothetical protein
VHTGFFGDDTLRLVVGSSPAVAIAQTQFADTLFEGWVLEVNYNPNTNSFHVYRNGEEVTSMAWVDSSNLVTHGSTKRKVGLTCSTGFGVTNFTYFDWD